MHPENRSWSLLSSYGLVLLYIARNPDSTLRELATAMNLTERHISRIVHELEAANMIESRIRGRRKLYHLMKETELKHPTMSHLNIGEFVDRLVNELPEEQIAAGDRPRGIRRHRRNNRSDERVEETAEV
jgi:DNA-binding MarR family transcriptional regulator